MDMRMQNWSKYESFGSTDANLDKGFWIGAGAEITPDAGDIGPGGGTFDRTFPVLGQSATAAKPSEKVERFSV